MWSYRDQFHRHVSDRARSAAPRCMSLREARQNARPERLWLDRVWSRGAARHIARVEVEAPSPLMVAQPLAGWGAGLEVERPPEVQAELARLGQELVDRYA